MSRDVGAIVDSFWNLGSHVQVDLPVVIQALDLLCLQQPRFQPIIVIREVQALRRMGPRGMQMLDQLLDACAAYKQGRALVRIIFETSDSGWLATETGCTMPQEMRCPSINWRWGLCTTTKPASCS